MKYINYGHSDSTVPFSSPPSAQGPSSALPSELSGGVIGVLPLCVMARITVFPESFCFNRAYILREVVAILVVIVMEKLPLLIPALLFGAYDVTIPEFTASSVCRLLSVSAVVDKLSTSHGWLALFRVLVIVPVAWPPVAAICVCEPAWRAN